MPRTARQIIPGQPHCITQKGNRGMPVFFKAEDYALYLDILAEQGTRYNVEFWAYCLLPNQINLIALPSEETGLGLALRETHRRYTRHINAREGWTGHLWQGRYASFPMDEACSFIAARYIENTPVRAGICTDPVQYRWSSAKFHTGKKPDDPLISRAKAKPSVPNWSMYLQEGLGGNDNITREEELLAKHERSGAPLVASPFTATAK